MAINAFRSLSGIFKRCIKVCRTRVLYVIPRRERQASDFLSVYYPSPLFLLQFAIVEGKDGLFLSSFFLFSPFFLHDGVNR